MKITRVRPWIVYGPPEEAGGRADIGGKLTYVFVQVETDEGLTGWGEITTYPGPIANRTIAAAIRELDALLGGDDPMQIEKMWHKIFRAYTYLGRAAP
jgi:galactonate dehydratase